MLWLAQERVKKSHGWDVGHQKDSLQIYVFAYSKQQPTIMVKLIFTIYSIHQCSIRQQLKELSLNER